MFVHRLTQLRWGFCSLFYKKGAREVETLDYAAF
jgi:hypothetical protein